MLESEDGSQKSEVKRRTGSRTSDFGLRTSDLKSIIHEPLLQDF
jgi:hypothetical protein